MKPRLSKRFLISILISLSVLFILSGNIYADEVDRAQTEITDNILSPVEVLPEERIPIGVENVTKELAGTNLGVAVAPVPLASEPESDDYPVATIGRNINEIHTMALVKSATSEVISSINVNGVKDNPYYSFTLPNDYRNFDDTNVDKVISYLSSELLNNYSVKYESYNYGSGTSKILSVNPEVVTVKSGSDLFIGIDFYLDLEDQLVWNGAFQGTYNPCVRVTGSSRGEWRPEFGPYEFEAFEKWDKAQVVSKWSITDGSTVIDGQENIDDHNFIYYSSYQLSDPIKPNPAENDFSDILETLADRFKIAAVYYNYDSHSIKTSIDGFVYDKEMSDRISSSRSEKLAVFRVSYKKGLTDEYRVPFNFYIAVQSAWEPGEPITNVTNWQLAEKTGNKKEEALVNEYIYLDEEILELTEEDNIDEKAARKAQELTDKYAFSFMSTKNFGRYQANEFNEFSSASFEYSKAKTQEQKELYPDSLDVVYEVIIDNQNFYSEDDQELKFYFIIQRNHLPSDPYFGAQSWQITYNGETKSAEANEYINLGKLITIEDENELESKIDDLIQDLSDLELKVFFDKVYGDIESDLSKTVEIISINKDREEGLNIILKITIEEKIYTTVQEDKPLNFYLIIERNHLSNEPFYNAIQWKVNNYKEVSPYDIIELDDFLTIQEDETVDSAATEKARKLEENLKLQVQFSNIYDDKMDEKGWREFENFTVSYDPEKETGIFEVAFKIAPTEKIYSGSDSEPLSFYVVMKRQRLKDEPYYYASEAKLVSSLNQQEYYSEDSIIYLTDPSYMINISSFNELEDAARNKERISSLINEFGEVKFKVSKGYALIKTGEWINVSITDLNYIENKTFNSIYDVVYEIELDTRVYSDSENLAKVYLVLQRNHLNTDPYLNARKWKLSEDGVSVNIREPIYLVNDPIDESEAENKAQDLLNTFNKLYISFDREYDGIKAGAYKDFEIESITYDPEKKLGKYDLPYKVTLKEPYTIENATGKISEFYIVLKRNRSETDEKLNYIGVDRWSLINNDGSTLAESIHHQNYIYTSVQLEVPEGVDKTEYLRSYLKGKIKTIGLYSDGGNENENPTGRFYSTDFYIKDLIPENPSSVSGFQVSEGQYLFRIDSPDSITFKRNSNNTLYIIVTLVAPIDKEQLKKEGLIVEANEPDNVTMNLFDYWNNIEDPSNEAGNPWSGQENDNLSSQAHNFGINANHYLKFLYQSWTNKDGANDDTKTYGVWNHSTESARENVKGLVQNTLVNNYPKLNLTQNTGDIWENFALSEGGNLYDANILHADDERYRTESLDYLFDPTVPHDGKESYANVSGLLQMNQEGYYYYDSKLNYAEFNEDTYDFSLYNTWGVTPSGESPNGQFFPFNSVNDAFDGVQTTKDENGDESKFLVHNSANSRSDKYNHHFGYTMEVDFQQPISGVINHGADEAEPMTFKFAGDDDIWVFIDDVLVLDLGGLHSGIYGEINFATGQITTGNMSKEIESGAELGGTNWVKGTTILSRFKAAGKAGEAAWGTSSRSNTFADGTVHTLKLFYMERGHWDSNFAMYFNLQKPIDHELFKFDADGEPLQGTEFSLYEASVDGKKYIPPSDTNWYQSKDAQPLDEEHPILTHITTDSDGYAQLADENISLTDFAIRASRDDDRRNNIYILREDVPPNGYKKLEKDIILRYDPSNNTFKVLNRYEVGAYSSFTAILEDNLDELYYATSEYVSYNGRNELFIRKSVEDDSIKYATQYETITDDHKKDAILFAVPMVYTQVGEEYGWYPGYGSNRFGYHIVDMYSAEEFFNSPEAWTYTEDGKPDKEKYPKGQRDTYEAIQESNRWALRHNLLATALRQAADPEIPDWYFKCEEVSNSTFDDNVSTVRFTAELHNLPGDASRYLVNSPDNNYGNVNGSDIRLVGLLVDAEALASFMSYDINGYEGREEEQTRIINEHLEKLKEKKDYEKYEYLREILMDTKYPDPDSEDYSAGLTYKEIWDYRYNQEAEDKVDKWEKFKDVLNAAYVSSQEGTKRERGVNLAYIDNFTQYYSSVIYIPNEKAELQVLKEDINGNPLPGTMFGLFTSAKKADEMNDPLAKGITDSQGFLSFRYVSPEEKETLTDLTGIAEVDWNVIATDPEDHDNFFWIRELEGPNERDGVSYITNDSLVKVVVDEHGVHASASGYYYDKNEGKAKLIDEDIPQKEDGSEYSLEELHDLELSGKYNSDNIYVLANPGKLYQSMKKFADKNLNETLLGIETTANLNFTGSYDLNKSEVWNNIEDSKKEYHYWGDELNALDYSVDHDNPTFVRLRDFYKTENGFIRLNITQSPVETFIKYHKDYENLLAKRREDITSIEDLSGIFSTLNIVVVQDFKTEELSKIEINPGAGQEVKVDDEVSYNINWNRIGEDESALESIVITDPLDPGVDFLEAKFKGYILTPTEENKVSTLLEEENPIYRIGEGDDVTIEYNSENHLVTWTIKGEHLSDKSFGEVFIRVRVNDRAFESWDYPDENISTEEPEESEGIDEDSEESDSTEDDQIVSDQIDESPLDYIIHNKGYVTFNLAGIEGEPKPTEKVDNPLTGENTGSLLIKKSVIGTLENNDETDEETKSTEFAFRLTLYEHYDPVDTEKEQVFDLNKTVGDITFKKGVAEFTLEQDQEVLIRDIPLDIEYVLEEIDSKGCIVEYENGNNIGKIAEKNEVITINVINKALGNLTLTKVVEGTLPENSSYRQDGFEFSITLDDESINGTYGSVEFKNGVATKNLRDGETVTVEGLPVGTGYVIEEKLDNSESEDEVHFIQRKFFTEGTIKKDTTISAAYLNEITDEDPKASLSVSKIVTDVTDHTAGPFPFNIMFAAETKEEIEQVKEALEVKEGLTKLGDNFTITDETNNSILDLNEVSADNWAIYQFELNSEERIEFNNLPPNISYWVEEAPIPGYNLFKIIGKNKDQLKAYENIGVTFVNSPVRGGLTISKLVKSHDNLDKSKDFKFTITLTDEKGSYSNVPDGQFSVKTYRVTKSEDGKESKEESQVTTFERKSETSNVYTAEITLSDQEIIELTGLAPETNYSVSENLTDEEEKLYEVSSTVLSGVIPSGYSEHASFVNTRIVPNGNLNITKLVTGEKDLNSNQSFKFTLDFSGNTNEKLEELPNPLKYELVADNSESSTKSVELEKLNDNTKVLYGTVELKAGQTATIKDLPAGLKYQIIEEPDLKYVLENQSNTSGTISANNNIDATFVNRKIEDFNPVKTEISPGNDKEVKIGDILEYQISWKNDTSAPAVITIEDTLDSKVDFVEASLGDIKLTGDSALDSESKIISITESININGIENIPVTISYGSESNIVNWEIGSEENYMVPSEASGIVSLKVRVNGQNLSIENHTIENQAIVSVNGTGKGTETIENKVNLPTHVLISIDHKLNDNGIEKQDDNLDDNDQQEEEENFYEYHRGQEPVSVGQRIDYKINLLNNGDGTAHNLNIYDYLPEYLELIDSNESETQFGILNRSIEVEDQPTLEVQQSNTNTPQLKWNIEKLEPGEGKTIEFSVVVQDDEIDGSTWLNHVLLDYDEMYTEEYSEAHEECIKNDGILSEIETDENISEDPYYCSVKHVDNFDEFFSNEVLYHTDLYDAYSADRKYANDLPEVILTQPVEVNLNLVKDFIDNTGTANLDNPDEEFWFVLKPVTDNALETIQDHDGFNNGNIEFSESVSLGSENRPVGTTQLSFTKIGTYIYTVEEIQGTNENIAYDSRINTVTITVSFDSVNAQLVAQVYINGSSTDIRDDGTHVVKFTNFYRGDQPTVEPSPTTGQLTISKLIAADNNEQVSDSEKDKPFEIQIKLKGEIDELNFTTRAQKLNANGESYSSHIDGESLVYTDGETSINFTNKEAIVYLKHQEQLILPELPLGVEYEVTEILDEVDQGLYNPTETGCNGTITSFASHAAITNVKYKDTGELTISKLVAPGSEEILDSEEFTFIVHLDSAVKEVSGNAISSYSFKKENRLAQNGDQGRALTPESGLLEFNSDGFATVYLMDGDIITISGIPLGTGYTVEEDLTNKAIEIDNKIVEIVSRSTGEVGTIDSSTEPAHVSFTNSLKPELFVNNGALIIKKAVNGNPENIPEKGFPITITLKKPDQTPLSGNYSGYNFDEEGQCSTSVKPDSPVIIRGLPQGTIYSVEEDEVKGYEVSYVDKEGIILDQLSFYTVLINNTEKTEDPETPNPSKEVVTPGNNVPVTVGELITYRIHWVNTKDETVNIKITDKLDPGVDFVDANPEAEYNEKDHTVIWNLTNIAANTKGAVELRVKVNENALKGESKVDNRASVQINNEQSVDTNTVENPAKPETKNPVKKEITPGEGRLVTVGEKVTYQIEYYNTEKESATVTIKDRLDPGVNFSSAKFDNVVLNAKADGTNASKSENGISITYDRSSHTVTWILENRPGYESKSVDLEVIVNDDAYFQWNYESSDLDKSAQDNRIINRATVQINNNPEVETKDIENPLDQNRVVVEKYHKLTTHNRFHTDDNFLKVGDTVYYQIIVTNTRNVVAENVILEDPIPPLMTLDRNSFTGSYSIQTAKVGYIKSPQVIENAQGTLVTWNLGNLEPNEKVTIEFAVKVGDPRVDEAWWINHAYMTYKNIADEPEFNMTAKSIENIVDEFTENTVEAAATAHASTAQNRVDHDSLYNAGLQLSLPVYHSYKIPEGIYRYTADVREYIAPQEEVINPTITKAQQVENGRITTDDQVVTRGSTLTYYITVKNPSSKTLNNVTVSDIIPAGLSYVEGSASDNGRYTNGSIYWNFSTLAPGAEITLSFKAIVSSDPIYIRWVNKAMLDWEDNPNNPVPSNEVIADTPQLSILKEQSTVGSQNADRTSGYIEFKPGDQVTYYITVTNTSRVPSTNTVITDKIPNGLVFVEGSASEGVEIIGDILTWNIGTLQPGQKHTVQVTFTCQLPEVVEEEVYFRNIAYVSWDENLPNNPEASNEVIIGDPPTPPEPVTPDTPENPFDNNNNNNTNNNGSNNNGSNNNGNTGTNVVDTSSKPTVVTSKTTTTTSTVGVSPQTGITGGIAVFALTGIAAAMTLVEKERRNKKRKNREQDK